jgi:hypothetical protein
MDQDTVVSERTESGKRLIEALRRSTTPTTDDGF